MALKYHRPLFYLVSCFFQLYFFYHHGVESSKYEDLDLELEKELDLLNKGSIKTIWTKRGERYNCVYFNKKHAPKRNQPTFNTTSYDNIDNSPRIYQSTLSDFWRRREGCPAGTVAIKGTTKDDLIRARIAADIYAEKNEPFTTGEPGTHYAVVHKSGKFYGALFTFSVWNPIVIGPQYSSSRMKLQSGEDSIEVGWMVNPSLYNDARTRAFVYTKSGGRHCFNAYCGMFIPENWNIGDDGFQNISKLGGPIYESTFLIYQEHSGDWVLQVAENKGQRRLGHWPLSNFKDLGNSATFIEWGGKVFSPPNIPSPPMGSGEAKLKYDLKYDAYCRNLQIMDQIWTEYFIPAVQGVSYYCDIPTYRVIDAGMWGHNNHLMIFGGVGGATGD